MIKLYSKCEADLLCYLRKRHDENPPYCMVAEEDIHAGLQSRYSISEITRAGRKLVELELAVGFYSKFRGQCWQAIGAESITRYEWPLALWEQDDA